VLNNAQSQHMGM